MSSATPCRTSLRRTKRVRQLVGEPSDHKGPDVDDVGTSLRTGFRCCSGCRRDLRAWLPEGHLPRDHVGSDLVDRAGAVLDLTAFYAPSIAGDGLCATRPMHRG